jgi:hypothetical protein
MVLVGGRMLLFLLVDNGLRLHGQMVLSPVVVLVLWLLPMLVRGQLLWMLTVGEGLHLEELLLLVVLMLLLLMLVVVELLHVGFFGWRPASASFTSGHRASAWRAVGDVAVGVVVAIVASSRPDVAPNACGQRVAQGGAF